MKILSILVSLVMLPWQSFGGVALSVARSQAPVLASNELAPTSVWMRHPFQSPPPKNEDPVDQLRKQATILLKVSRMPAAPPPTVRPSPDKVAAGVPEQSKEPSLFARIRAHWMLIALTSASGLVLALTAIRLLPAPVELDAFNIPTSLAPLGIKAGPLRDQVDADIGMLKEDLSDDLESVYHGGIENQLRSLKSRHSPMRIWSPEMLPDFEIPETKISWQAVLRLLRKLTGKESAHIHLALEIPVSEAELKLARRHARITVTRTEGEEARRVFDSTVSLSDREALRRQILEGILRAADPYSAAVYLASRQQPDAALHILREGEWSGRDRAWRYLLEAFILMDRVQNEDALRNVQAAIQARGFYKFPEAYNIWGELLFSSDPQRALEKFEIAIRQDPDYPDPYENEVRLASTLPNGQALARKNFERMLRRKLDPSFAYGEAEDSVNEKDYFDRAEKVLRQTILDGKGTIDDYQALAVGLIKNKRYAEGVHLFLDGLQKFPEAHRSRLWLHFSDDMDVMSSLYLTYLKVRPLDADAYLEWANLLTRAGKLEAARLLGAKASVITPTRPEPWVLQGQILVKEGHRKEGEIAFRHALKLEPGDVQAAEGLYKILGIQGRRREQLSLISVTLKNLQETHNYSFLKGQSFKYLDDLLKAVLRRRFEMNPLNETASRVYAQSFPDENIYERLVTLDPLNMDLRLSFAYWLFSHGRLTESAQECRKVIEQDPTNQEGYISLAQVLQDQSNISGIRQLIEESVRNMPASQRSKMRMRWIEDFLRESSKVEVVALISVQKGDPLYGLIQLAQGEYDLYSGRAANAVPYLREAFANSPSEETYEPLIRAYRALRDDKGEAAAKAAFENRKKLLLAPPHASLAPQRRTPPLLFTAA